MEDTAGIRILAVKIKIRSGFMKNFKGFSLAEMMIVLLIISITLAATAPMITRKITKTQSQENNSNNEQVFRPLKSDPKHVVEYVKGLNQRITMGPGIKEGVGITESGQEVPHSSVIIGSVEKIYDSTGKLRGDDKYKNFNAEEGIVAIGFTKEAFPGSINIGNRIKATGFGSIAIGHGATVEDSSGGIAINGRVTAPGRKENASTNSAGRGIAIGGFATYNSVALGTPSTAKDDAVAIGADAIAQDSGVAIGRSSSAGYNNVIASGCSIEEKNPNIAIGQNAHSACNSIAIGGNALVEGNNLIVLGHNIEKKFGHKATDIANSIVIGNNAEFDNNSIAIGRHAGVDENSIAIGEYAEARGRNSIAIGNDVHTGRDNSIVIGTPEHTVTIRGELIADLQTPSDIRLKNLGNPYTDGLEALNKLKFYHYTFKKDKAQTPHVGVIAQELQKVFPNAVTKGSDGYLQIRLEDMFYAAINAIKELNTKVITLAENMVKLTEKTDKQQEELTAQAELINIQQQKIDELTARLEKLEKRKK